MLRLTLFLCLGLLLAQCRPATDAPDSSTDADGPRIWYSVFPRAFADGDGDGLGDLRGLRERLDELQALGVEGLWLLPIHPSPTYHKYDVSDYYGVDSTYGDLAELRRLVDAAHARGMKVILDLVLNHSSAAHPWFRAALADSADFRARYVWADSADIGEEAHLWHPHPDRPGDPARYYGFFWKSMPDLNYEHPAVRAEAKAIARFWLDSMGVDGFRLDAALHIYPYYVSERAGNLAKTTAWWREFRAAVDSIRPDAYLVGEVWEGDSVLIDFAKDGLHSTFNFDLAKNILHLLRHEADGLHFAEGLAARQRRFAAAEAGYQDAIFLSNHDQNRLMSELGGHEGKAKLAASLLFSLPGHVFLYYGEELGMKGSKPDEHIREPLPWGEARHQTRWRPWLHNGPDSTRSLAAQRADEQSIWRHYQRWAALRRQWPALRRGELLPKHWAGQPAALLAYERRLGTERLLVLHNLSGQALPLEAAWTAGRGVFVSGENGKNGQPSALPPYGSAIWHY